MYIKKWLITKFEAILKGNISKKITMHIRRVADGKYGQYGKKHIYYIHFRHLLLSLSR